jgi:hypothetical protein
MRPETNIETPKDLPSDAYGAAYFERQFRQAMDDMLMFRSFEGLRELTAEILNEMADNRSRRDVQS